MASPILPFVLAIALLLGVASSSDGHGKIKFSYSGSNGPDKWGNLDPTFAACSSGKVQSPINIFENQTVANKNLKTLTRNYKDANATLVSHIVNIGVQFSEPVGEISIDGKSYNFSQLHWHSPSEHLIDGVQYEAELHMVHKAEDQSIAVVGILFKYGHADPFLAQIHKALNELAKANHSSDDAAEVPLGTLDTKHLNRSTRRYFRYVGSLTTPPCTENVTWTVLGKVRSISKEQIAALQAPLSSGFKHNARPLQPLNGRKIEEHRELDD